MYLLSVLSSTFYLSYINIYFIHSRNHNHRNRHPNRNWLQSMSPHSRLKFAVFVLLYQYQHQHQYQYQYQYQRYLCRRQVVAMSQTNRLVIKMYIDSLLTCNIILRRWGQAVFLTSPKDISILLFASLFYATMEFLESLDDEDTGSEM
jgi:hypothetical protein